MDYIHINKDLWNKRTKHHLESGFYDMEAFMEGKSPLHKIELDLLGDVTGKSILHLQCHFGQDTLALARMGAKVTGVDFSDQAIKAAEKINSELQLDAKFICCNIYDLPQYLDEQFDMVFTSYGTIGWLPDIKKWGSTVSTFLKPGGIFVFAEFHPVVWMFDNDFTKVTYRYFNDDPIIETNEGTYANRDAPIRETSVGWNHSIGEVVESLVENDLQLLSLKEYDYSPHDCFAHAEKTEEGFRIRHLGNMIPMVYSITAVKQSCK